jgi:hypothetical protein
MRNTILDKELAYIGKGAIVANEFSKNNKFILLVTASSIYTYNIESDIPIEVRRIIMCR